MGEQIGATVPGRLYYVTRKEFDRIRSLNASIEDRIRLFADACRLNTLYMIAKAGSGHIGSSFSSLVLYSMTPSIFFCSPAAYSMAPRISAGC